METKPVVLIVDDEPEIIQALAGILGERYQLKIATNGQKALDIAMTMQPPDLILLDILLPDLSGYEVCRRLKMNPATRSVPVIFISALSAVEDESYGFEMGAADYISKPFSAPIVQARAATHLALHDQRRDLELQVRERTQELRESRLEILRQLGKAAEYKDNETGYHVIRMSFYAYLLALKAGLDSAQVDLILQASPLHDIGKIGIPDHILQKPGKLTSDEWSLMKNHCEFGATIIGDSHSQVLRLAKQIALSHHEKWDGSGYPLGLKGEQIPLVGRIVAISDVFDALVSARPYKSAWSVEEAMSYIRNEKGRHFDPTLVSLFELALPEILDIASCYKDNGVPLLAKRLSQR